MILGLSGGIDSALVAALAIDAFGVDKVRFKKLVTPGDQLVIRSKAIMNKRDIYKFECTAHVDGALACSAEIMIARQKVDGIS